MKHENLPHEKPPLLDYQYTLNFYGKHFDMNIQDLIEHFAFIDDWEERYRFLIELGRTLPSLDDAYKTDANKVHGCTSQVWLVPQYDPSSHHLQFQGDSDSFIVKGLIFILLTTYNHHTPSAILQIDIKSIFGQFGLQDHLSPNRSNGFFSMVQYIQTIAQHYHESCQHEQANH